MRARMVIHCVDSHTAGEPTRVVVAGLPPIPGCTMAEKKAYLQVHHDTVRCGLLREPRGHHDMFGAILLPPTRPEASLGVVFMDNGGYLSMCGHGTIGVVTTALETGIIPCHEPVTEVVIDTPAGLVYTRALVEKGQVREVTFRNVPAFVFQRDLPVRVPGWGEVQVDVAFGGNFFAIVSARELHLALQPHELDTLVQLGIRIRDAVNAALPVRHPAQPHLTGVELVEFSEPLEPPVPALEPGGLRTPAGSPAPAGARGPACSPDIVVYRNVVVFGEGSVDRSPCGTGTCAKMSSLYARGELQLGQEFWHYSILDTLFKGRLVGTTTVGDGETALPAVMPEITGSAHLTAFQQFLFDPDDPFVDGFLLSRFVTG